ncbi:hypothetical protein BDB00DRAFT_295592 [Zychaea mexicana]|uniref:uncharacterized protein n=1 Tax=Zychaea mexicana TaxID=64656 RepID=UPI0022FE2B1E|nr:uncharacterized protein BDB00DRAFT_295592 [Zychaea mexicana]KAI9494590.1 hypothetical protein BDB00DRAFT_295592 [Zychaea mexicana]
MDFTWISDVTGTRKHPPYLSKPSTAGPSPSLVRTLDNSSLRTASAAPGGNTTTTVRRPRAGTMPASMFPYASESYMSSTLGAPLVSSTDATSSSAASAAAAAASRHRSGSATFATESGLGATLFSSALSPSSSIDAPVSSVDEAAGGTIVSTLASLGLDDDSTYQDHHTHNHRSSRSNNDNSNGSYAPLPALSITASGTPSTSIPAAGGTGLPTPVRSRAYTVGTRMERPNIGRLLAPSTMRFDPFSLENEQTTQQQQQQQQQQQRPRAISLGMVDESPAIPPSLQLMYQTQQQHQQQASLRTSRSSNNLLDVLSYNDEGHDYQQQDLITAASSSSTPSSPSSAAAQIPSRALWLGNITPSLSISDLLQLFSCYGTVESARILSDKECAFVNFTNVESAVAARNDLETRLGSKLQGATVRVGYGKADVSQAMANTTEAGPNAQGPTRALSNMNPGILRTIFQPFGAIESVRVLSHKNCGFVNFEQQQDAVRARRALQNKEILGPGTGAVRIGFAKAPVLGTAAPNVIPPPPPAATIDEVDDRDGFNLHATLSAASAAASSPDTYQATQWAAAMMMSSMMKGVIGQQYNPAQPSAAATTAAHPTSLYAAIAAERRFIMQQLDHETVSAEEASQDERAPMTYCSAIPLVPELGSDRKLEPLRLREMRKRLDNGQALQDVENMALECMDEVVELCNDYIGNTVIQKIFEFCTDETRLCMLERIAPFLASIGVHKNGTWAAQKIIDHANTPTLIQIISTHIAPYVPLLLLDQYGNYVVQCCLRKGADSSQYIMDAIADKCWEIGQGRFGARAVRAILENPVVTREQQVYVGAAIIQNAVLLTTNANGVLLLIWLLDTSELPGRFGALCPRLLPYLSKLCTHKLGAMTIYKMINQCQDLDARNLLLNAIFNEAALLDDVLRDQVHGLGLVQKIIAIAQLDRRDELVKLVMESLTERLHVQATTQAYKRLFEEIEQQQQQQQQQQQGESSTPAIATVKELNEEHSCDEHQQQWTQSPQAVAMMANMYAAAMATAAATMQHTVPAPAPAMPDLTQFDNLIKSLLRNSTTPSSTATNAVATASIKDQQGGEKESVDINNDVCDDDGDNKNNPQQQQQ